MLSRLADRLQQSAQPEVLHRGVRLGKLYLFHFAEIGRIQDRYSAAELIQEFSIGRDFKSSAAAPTSTSAAPAPASAGILRLIDRLHDLLLNHIDDGVFGLADLVAVCLFYNFGGGSIQKLSLGVGRAAIDSVAVRRIIQYKMIRDFVRGDVQHFEAVMVVS